MKTQRFTQYILIAISLFTLIGASSSAHAKVKLKVKNCADTKMLVCVFNGKDSSLFAESDFARIKDGDSATLKCEGQGKGGCKIKVNTDASKTCVSGTNTHIKGRYKGHFLLYGDEGSSQFIKVTESEYKDSNACDNHD